MTIQIDHLHKSYGSGAEAHEVLHDINLTIDSGEVFGILGSSGAGKSTLVRCINLLERPTSGKVRVDGEDITDAKGKELADVRAGIGMIFQNFSLFQQRTVLRNVTFPLELNHTPKNKREAAVRRPAAARGHRTRVGQQSVHHAVRRGHQRTRLHHDCADP